MVELKIFNVFVIGWLITALPVFWVLLRRPAPYGRHSTKSPGSTIPNRAGWLIMELPSPVFFGYFYLTGNASKTMVSWIFFSCWLIHYVYRTLIFPLRQRTAGKKIPVSIVLMAIVFNCINGFINGYYLGDLSTYSIDWAKDLRFMAGFLFFFTGLGINVHSDNILLTLRKNSNDEYAIPHGGLFKRVSCPNYLGEMIEWGGFALMTWALPALSFFIWTSANLIPRALAHHRWYLDHFSEYPKTRKALMPYFL